MKFLLLKQFSALFFLLSPVIVLMGQDKFKKENLGDSINSEYHETYPIISPDGNTIYFARDNHPENVGGKRAGKDIWYSTKKNGGWSKAKNIGKPLNNIHNNSICGITPDNNTALLFWNYDNSNAPASLSRKQVGGWSNPRSIRIKDINKKSKKFSVYLGSNSETLIFSMVGENTQGGFDIYVSFQKENGVWSSPKNLGPQVNSDKNEITPYLAADMQSLYFSSNREGGYGKTDVYVTRRKDGTWKNWSKPENLGPSINTEGKDFYYVVPASGKYAYFASDKHSKGKGDIFRTKIPDEYKPRATVIVSGRVLDKKNGEPVKAAIKYENLNTNKEVGMAKSNPSNGKYKIALPAGAKYGFYADAKGYISFSENIDLNNVTEFKQVKRNIKLKKMEVGETFELNNVFFDLNDSTLKKESFSELNRLVDLLNKNPKLKIKIEGHTDNQGEKSYNKKLSQARARSVKKYLLKNGISEKRLQSMGYGESQPIADNKTEKGRQKNRRVEFEIMSK